ncbi:hypothetical protein D9756_001115 [Leucocoprinus leucothites]|uniref:Ribosome assembly protein 3 n=1 Tax=Leucocoprinus leucothites TaxID=201217 RepID=A0A8H5GG09_9AGAR|nr:hypothetical protein D9756_001115 [Leucoagaricus leucothites]
MPPAKSANPAPKKRTRKRKRRAASLSSSSSSSESSSSEDESLPKIVKTVPKVSKPVEESSESESDSDSSDSSSSTSTSAVAPSKDKLPTTTPTPKKSSKLRRSPSPSPPPAEIPSFLPPRGDASAEEKEMELKEKFRKFWMSSVADGFQNDLEELRKEPNLGTGRLALLIDSLASGADIFSSKADGDVSEMDVVMG